MELATWNIYPVRCSHMHPIRIGLTSEYERMVDPKREGGPMHPEEAFYALGVKGECCREVLFNPTSILFGVYTTTLVPNKEGVYERELVAPADPDYITGVKQLDTRKKPAQGVNNVINMMRQTNITAKPDAGTPPEDVAAPTPQTCIIKPKTSVIVPPGAGGTIVNPVPATRVGVRRSIEIKPLSGRRVSHPPAKEERLPTPSPLSSIRKSSIKARGRLSEEEIQPETITTTTVEPVTTTTITTTPAVRTASTGSDYPQYRVQVAPTRTYRAI